MVISPLLPATTARIGTIGRDDCIAAPENGWPVRACSRGRLPRGRARAIADAAAVTLPTHTRPIRLPVWLLPPAARPTADSARPGLSKTARVRVENRPSQRRHCPEADP